MIKPIENTETVLPTNENIPRLGRSDPLLQELWAVKAAMNAEAGYSIEKRAERARQFDLESTIARLRQQISH
ncbi:MAG: hypothetical protein Q8O37_01730 [Sulfuricellaceae bacterium]|nr:hypothetical protein [Sulfuricellaceae bacterium]